MWQYNQANVLLPWQNRRAGKLGGGGGGGEDLIWWFDVGTAKLNYTNILLNSTNILS